jgi:hypothetical protein
MCVRFLFCFIKLTCGFVLVDWCFLCGLNFLICVFNFGLFFNFDLFLSTFKKIFLTKKQKTKKKKSKKIYLKKKQNQN